ncbi:hypothetical protein V8F33_005618 [Rhypophila sp. PSN 637]
MKNEGQKEPKIVPAMPCHATPSSTGTGSKYLESNSSTSNLVPRTSMSVWVLFNKTNTGTGADMFPWLTLMPLGEKGKYKFSSNRDKSETVVASGPQVASVKAGWPEKNGLLYLQSTGKEQYKLKALIDNANQAVGCSIMTTDKTSVDMINTRRCRSKEEQSCRSGVQANTAPPTSELAISCQCIFPLTSDSTGAHISIPCFLPVPSNTAHIPMQDGGNRLRQWMKTEEGFIHEEPLSAIYSERIGWSKQKAANALTGSIKSWEAQQLVAQAPFLGLCIRSDMLIWPFQQAESPQLDNIEMSLAILVHHVLDTLKTLDLHAVVRLGVTSPSLLPD